jgi:hypothetical protein
MAFDLLQTVSRRARKTRLVAHALPDHRWVANISRSLTIVMLQQYIRLWDRLQGVHVNSSRSDKFVWKWAPDKKILGAFGVPGLLRRLVWLTGG